MRQLYAMGLVVVMSVVGLIWLGVIIWELFLGFSLLAYLGAVIRGITRDTKGSTAVPEILVLGGDLV